MQGLKVVIVCGLPGSGKSTLSERISKKLGWPVFSVDPIESAILKSGIERGFETGLAAYMVAETLADEQLKLGHSTIVDAVSAVDESKQMWRSLAAKHKAELVIIEVHCSDEKLHKQHLQARVKNLHGIPEVTWEDVDKRRKQYVAWKEHVLKLNSTEKSEANVMKAIRYITR